MIASLPMYARAFNRAAHDALWHLIRDELRDRGITAPDQLDHNIDYMEVWDRDDLVLGHICNLPYRALFRDKVTLIGASDYGLPDCPAGYYNSLFIARSPGTPADFAARYACNDLLSQSGYGAAQLWAQRERFTLNVVTVTGSHNASIAAVAKGTADLASIDAQTWRLEQAEGNPRLRDLHIIGQTSASPGMSFITRRDQDPAPYRDAIDAAINGLPRAHRQVLGLRAIVSLSEDAYDIPLPPKPEAFAH
ncbi:phosphate/phosphite/phosphonate ABC transporter substrate-binding protein [Loktanella agnita]|uniref:phosphate/phosphite/phosphonate ABC transporter substrate-binding protein n=1 Tax=Loktanella agnita TaxID=287097 RepID=UPI003989C308